MKERIFIRSASEQIELEEFLKKQFSLAKNSDIEVQYTPVGTRIIIYTVTPALVIGAGGERIKEAVKVIKEKFSIENPQIDVQKIEKPDLDPKIVAQNIAEAIEGGVSFKRIGNYYLERIMNAGAIGCEIVLSGKFSGARGRTERFTAGYIKKCGEPSERNVRTGFAVAQPKLGSVGIKVRIMVERGNDPLERLERISHEEKSDKEEEKIDDERV